MPMINRLVFVFIFIFSLIVAQSDLQNGIRYYNQRHDGCVEDRADPKPISQAISHFEKALADQKNKDEASLYLLKTYYFKAKFAENNKQKKKNLLKISRILDMENDIY